MATLTGTQIKNTYQSLLKINTNGSLDPNTAVAISDGLGNNTPLMLSGSQYQTQVVSASKPYGFWADLSANSHVALGDFFGQYNGTQLYLSDYTKLIQTYGGAPRGFKLDFVSRNYKFGDYNSSTNGTMLEVDESNEIIGTKNINEPKGLYFDFNNATYKFGDFNGYGNGSALIISDAGENIYTLNNGAAKGINLDYSNSIYTFGVASDGMTVNNGLIKTVTVYSNGTQYVDIDGANNTSYFGIDGARLFSNNASYCALGDYSGSINNIFLETDNFNQLIQTKKTSPIGLKLDFPSKTYSLGDFGAVDNGTSIAVDDGNEEIELTANSKITLTGTNFISSTSTPLSNTHLKIWINGTEYRIKLDAV
jgi:hypothetical protein